MRAAYWNGQRLHIENNYPLPQGDEHTALVQIHLAGICSTDLQIFQGYMGFEGIPGHEFIGEVKEGPERLVGKRVVGEINFACGHCTRCAEGLGRHCATRRVMGILQADGAFAEYLAIPIVNLHPVVDDIPDETAVFAEPLAAAFEILEQVHLQPTDQVIVLGDGKLGLLCAQVLQLTGARVSLVGHHPHKLALAQAQGIDTVALKDAASATRIDPADVVVEATGSTAGLQLAMDMVRPRGTLVLKSTVANNHDVSLAPLVINEITVVGSRCGQFPPALNALAQNRLSIHHLIEATYPLADASEAIAHASRRGALKVLLRP